MCLSLSCHSPTGPSCAVGGSRGWQSRCLCDGCSHGNGPHNPDHFCHRNSSHQHQRLVHSRRVYCYFFVCPLSALPVAPTMNALGGSKGYQDSRSGVGAGESEPPGHRRVERGRGGSLNEHASPAKGCPSCRFYVGPRPSTTKIFEQGEGLIARRRAAARDLRASSPFRLAEVVVLSHTAVSRVRFHVFPLGRLFLIRLSHLWLKLRMFFCILAKQKL